MSFRMNRPEIAASSVTKETTAVTPLGRLTCLTHRPRGLVIGLVVLIGAMLSATAAHAAAPAWTLEMSHNPPHNFERVQHDPSFAEFKVKVQNSGDDATTGTYVLEDILPTQPTVSKVFAGSGWACTATEQVIAGVPLSCSSDAVLAPGQIVNAVRVLINVSPSAPDSLTNTATISGGGAATASAEDSAPVIDRPPFDVASFTADSTDSSGDDYTIAGGHPFQTANSFSWPFRVFEEDPFGVLGQVPVEVIKSADASPPFGFFGNPAAAPRCPIDNIGFLESFNKCPPGSKVGYVELFIEGGGPFSQPALYNVKPEKGVTAQFVFNYQGDRISLQAILRSRAESYGLTIGSPGTQRLQSVTGFAAHFYGVPSQNGSGTSGAPFLTNPVNCGDAQPTWKLAIDSWENPGTTLPSGLPDLTDPNWKTASAQAPPVTGCTDPALASQFDPTIAARPLQGAGPVQPDQPTGLKVNLDFPQSNDPTDPEYISGAKQYDPSIPQAPELKDITVQLPAGLTISPSSAGGLGACSDLASDPAGDQVHYDDTEPVTCPDSSKLGTAVATSPLLAAHDPETDAVTGAEPIEGDVYLLKPHPGDLVQGQDGKFRLLIQLENPRYGINLKLPGIAVANQQTGRLTATFTENPQLPAKNLTVTLKEGPRAPLATPTTCGTYTTTTDLVPWSTPGTPDAHPSSSFQIGSGCASSPGARPFAPTLSAGTESSKAGASSPFVLKLTRADGEQEISSLDTTLPKGLLAKLAGVPYCPEAAIAAASGRSGVAEQASPSCPSASQIGTVTAGAGPGTNPYYVTGNAYLAGPYKGAPLSAVFITPAVAGPFDLGNVVVRAALQVDPETAQVTVKTDPIPQILDGVPLRLRSIVARVDRPGFTLNPTSCEPMAVSATVGGSSGATAKPSNSFQVGDCEALAFRPKLKLSLKGSTKHAGHPALKAVLTYPQGPGYANIARAQVNLPHSEFIDQANLNKTCTKPVLLAGNCPAKSIYGRAKAWTPLLEKPLEGPVYLVGGYGYKLPALVADLNGQIRVVLKAESRLRPEPRDPQHLRSGPRRAGRKIRPRNEGRPEVLPARKLRKPLRQTAEGDRPLHRPERQGREPEADDRQRLRQG